MLNKKALVILGLSLVVGMSLSACKKKSTLAKIGSHTITQEDFQARLDAVPDYYGDFFETERGKRELLDSIVREYIVSEAARKKKLNKDSEFEREVKEFENQLLVTKMIRDIKDDEIRVTDDEIKSYYDTRKDYYENPEERKVSHILVTSEEEANDIYQRIAQDEDFAELAKNYSIDTGSKDKGGDIGFFKKGDLTPIFEDTAFALNNVGDVSNPVETQFGFHIIKLKDMKSLPALEYSEVSDEIRKIMEKDKFDDWMNKQKKDLNVQVKYELLKEKEETKEEAEEPEVEE